MMRAHYQKILMRNPDYAKTYKNYETAEGAPEKAALKEALVAMQKDQTNDR